MTNNHNETLDEQLDIFDTEAKQQKSEVIIEQTENLNSEKQDKGPQYYSFEVFVWERPFQEVPYKKVLGYVTAKNSQDAYRQKEKKYGTNEDISISAGIPCETPIEILKKQRENQEAKQYQEIKKREKTHKVEQWKERKDIN